MLKITLQDLPVLAIGLAAGIEFNHSVHEQILTK
jgi:hypothetical protein